MLVHLRGEEERPCDTWTQCVRFHGGSRQLLGLTWPHVREGRHAHSFQEQKPLHRGVARLLLLVLGGKKLRVVQATKSNVALTEGSQACLPTSLPSLTISPLFSFLVPRGFKITAKSQALHPCFREEEAEGMSAEGRALQLWRDALSGMSAQPSSARSVSHNTPRHKGSWENWSSGALLLVWQELLAAAHTCFNSSRVVPQTP